jgi:hypothetical protein
MNWTCSLFNPVKVNMPICFRTWVQSPGVPAQSSENLCQISIPLRANVQTWRLHPFEPPPKTLLCNHHYAIFLKKKIILGIFIYENEIEGQQHTPSLQSIIELVTHADDPVCHALQLHSPFLEKAHAQHHRRGRLSILQPLLPTLIRTCHLRVHEKITMSMHILRCSCSQFENIEKEVQQSELWIEGSKYPSAKMVAAMAAPWVGGLEYMGRITSFN